LMNAPMSVYTLSRPPCRACGLGRRQAVLIRLPAGGRGAQGVCSATTAVQPGMILGGATRYDTR
jgi:hypothetical protein